jgi:hypothetical protein
MADLRPGQYKRLGRIAENNPQRAEKVAARMEKRASRTERGKEVAAKVQESKGVARKAISNLEIEEKKAVRRQAVSQYRRAEERPRTERAQAMSKEEFEKKKSALNKSAGRDTPLAPSPIPTFLK